MSIARRLADYKPKDCDDYEGSATLTNPKPAERQVHYLNKSALLFGVNHDRPRTSARSMVQVFDNLSQRQTARLLLGLNA